MVSFFEIFSLVYLRCIYFNIGEEGRATAFESVDWHKKHHFLAYLVKKIEKR